MEEGKQHVQLPNNMTKERELTPKDLLIYVCIKRYMNNKTKEAFPSLEVIMDHSGSSKPTVRKCIENLKDKGYLEVKRDGRKNVYKFNEYKSFEPFSYEFLDRKDLTANEKAYLIATQQFMYKDNNFGKITYSNNELATLINISPNSVKKYDQSLESKGYLTTCLTKAKNPQTGLQINEKIFHLDELGQAIVFTLQNHEDRIKENTEDINKIKKDYEDLKKTVNILLREKQMQDAITKEQDKESRTGKID